MYPVLHGVQSLDPGKLVKRPAAHCVFVVVVIVGGGLSVRKKREKNRGNRDELDTFVTKHVRFSSQNDVKRKEKNNRLCLSPSLKKASKK